MNKKQKQIIYSDAAKSDRLGETLLPDCLDRSWKLARLYKASKGIDYLVSGYMGGHFIIVTEFTKARQFVYVAGDTLPARAKKEMGDTPLYQSHRMVVVSYKKPDGRQDTNPLPLPPIGDGQHRHGKQ